MPAASTRLLIGFGAGALSHVVFQGGLGAVLYAAQLMPKLIWSLEPVPPFGVPTTLNNMFWDGLWGVIYALVEPRLTARLGRWRGGLAFGVAPLVVYWFVVLPLKGAGVAGGFDPGLMPVHLAFDLVFGLGTAVFFRAGLRLAGHRGALGRPSHPKD